jgi:hypothetical protein
VIMLTGHDLVDEVQNHSYTTLISSSLRFGYYCTNRLIVIPFIIVIKRKGNSSF